MYRSGMPETSIDQLVGRVTKRMKLILEPQKLSNLSGTKLYTLENQFTDINQDNRPVLNRR